MRPISLPFRYALLAAVLVLCAETSAPQTARETQSAPLPTGLALEVDTKEGPIGHHSVPGSYFGGRYRRLPDWRPPAGSQPLRTFKLINAPEGDGVRIKVFVVMDRFHEQEVLLGDYLLREGEKATVEAMRTFGYEPIEVTVVRVTRMPSAPPVATSKVPSVAVTGVEERQANFPSFKVALRNLSHKDIIHLEVKTYKGGKLSSAQWPRAEHNRPLMKAGEAYEVSVVGGGRGLRSPDGFTPSAPESVEVVTAVFADESYEGEEHSVAVFVAGLRGQKMQIVRALALWEGVVGGERADARAALDDFERRVQALDRKAPATPEGLPAGMSGLTQQGYEKLKIYVEGGLDQVRKELLKDIQEYRRARESAAEGRQYNAWLGGLRKKYEDWLSRL